MSFIAYGLSIFQFKFQYIKLKNLKAQFCHNLQSIFSIIRVIGWDMSAEIYLLIYFHFPFTEYPVVTGPLIDFIYRLNRCYCINRLYFVETQSFFRRGRTTEFSFLEHWREMLYFARINSIQTTEVIHKSKQINYQEYHEKMKQFQFLL